MLTLVVIGFIAYLGVQLLRFAKPPTLAVSAPVAAVLDVEDGTTSYTFSGTSIPGATIEITASGREQPYRASADADGAWSVDVDLSRGRNQFVVDARVPDTGKAAEEPVQRGSWSRPSGHRGTDADGQFTRRWSDIRERRHPGDRQTTNANSVTVAATLLGPATGAPTPSAAPSVSPSPSPAPSPAASAGAPSPSPALPADAKTVTPADDGTFSVPLELTTGRWSVVVTASSPEGKTTSITRSVTVSYSGVNLVVAVDGGRAWLKVWVDGKLDASTGAAGRVVGDGKTLTFSATQSIEVRTGNSGVTYFTLNGEALGALGRRGIPETWLFAPPDQPKKTSRS